MALVTERAKILLVDDRPENLLALEAILSALDQELVRANSGEEALRALLKDEFALILLDARMPGMDGFETAARIKGRNRTKNVPIIFLTAVDTDKNNTFRGYAAGAADYIAKPFDPWVLRAKVQVFVDLWVAGRRLATQAAFLRRQIGGGQDTIDVLGELRERVAEVEEAVEVLSVGLQPTDDPIVRGSADRVARRVASLKQALEVLDSDPANVGVGHHEFS
jgi:CheY-like chemotaxis protein